MQTEIIPRLIEFNKYTRITALTAAILSIPIKISDAILLFPGMGEHYRTDYAVALWQKGFGKKLLISGISSENIRRHGAYTRKNIIEHYCLDPNNSDIIIVSDHGENTLQQAEWAFEIIRQNNINSLVLTTSYYHIPRSFLTLIKVLKKENIRIPIYPAPSTPLSEEYLSLIPGEVKRIRKYQKRGDIATFDEFRDYFSWQTKNY